MLLLWYTALFVAVIVAAVCTADPCVFKAGTMVPYDSALECIRTVAFNKEIFDSTLDTIAKSLPLYVFIDIARDSPDPVNIPMQVDLLGDIARIKASTYSRDYDFHRDVQEVFRPLYDGHTWYYLPTCYTNFQPLQPFLLVSYVDESGDVVIKISGLVSKTAQAYKDLFGYDLTPLVGATVLRINGTTASEYLLQFANHSIGMSKDIQGRYNYALTRYLTPTTFSLGAFTSRTHSPHPKYGETVEYLIQTSTEKITLLLPWIGNITTAVQSSQQFANWCYSPAQKNVKYSVVLQEPVLEIPKSSAAVDFEIIPLLESESVSFYKIADDTAVLVVPSFMPSNYTQFGSNLEKGFKILVSENLHRLIVDVSNNGGGDLCLGYTLVEMIFAEFSPYGANDMIQSPLGLSLAMSALKQNITDTYWSPEYWTSYDTNKTFPHSIDWFVPGHKYIRGGISSNYSELFRDDCEIYFKILSQPEGLHYSPSQLRVLSNGYCASTCSVFSRHMQEFDGVKTIVVGGVPDLSMGISFIPGGQVVEVNEVVSAIEELGETGNPLAPKDFPTTAHMRFTLREIYPFKPFNTEIPLEYIYEPADYHIQYTAESAVNPRLIWKDALRTFDS